MMLRPGETLNGALVDRAIRHAHMIERFKAGEVREILRILNDDVFPDIIERVATRLARIRSRGFDTGPWTTNQLRDLLAGTRETLRTGMRAARDMLVGDMRLFAVSEAEWQAAIVGRILPFEFNFATPSPTLLRSIVTSQPMQGRFLRDWFDGLATGTQDAVTRQINIGLATGEGTDQIVRRLRGTQRARFQDGVLQTSRRQAATVVRTAVNHVSNMAREATYSANDDVIDGIQWVSTLDARTSDICASLDGQVFGIAEGPRPPAHHQCRSTTVPVLKSFRQLGIPIDEIPPGTRASIDGQVSAKVTYGEWLRRQPVEVQNEVLGKGRAAVFRRGNVPIERFIDQTLRPLTLRELLEREAALLAA